MKKLGTLLLMIPAVWFFGWMVLLTFTTPEGDYISVNPLIYFKFVYAILQTPATWITAIIGIIGYLIQRDAK